MRVSALCLIAVPLAVSAYQPPWAFSRVVRDATDFTFSLFTGSELQDTTSAQTPEQLEYTTGSGVPYV